MLMTAFRPRSRFLAVALSALIGVLALPATSLAVDDGGHYYTVAPEQEQTQYYHTANPWQKGEAQYNGQCEGCGKVEVFVGIRNVNFHSALGYVAWNWGSQGYITAYVSQYDYANKAASHTIWGWFWHP
jgi:hypothetical protein